MRRTGKITVRFDNQADADAGERALAAADMTPYVESLAGEGDDELAICVDDIYLDALQEMKRDVRRALRPTGIAYVLEVEQ